MASQDGGEELSKMRRSLPFAVLLAGTALGGATLAAEAPYDLVGPVTE